MCPHDEKIVQASELEFKHYRLECYLKFKSELFKAEK